MRQLQNLGPVAAEDVGHEVNLGKGPHRGGRRPPRSKTPRDWWPVSATGIH